MKRISITTAFLFVANLMLAQSITFTFVNSQNTTDGVDDFFEADIYIESDTDFKLGSGQLYFNYNTVAFGENVVGSGNFEYLFPAGSILAEENILEIYKDRNAADNTSNRVSTVFQQLLGSGSIPANNVTTTAKHLFSIKMRYQDVTQDPMVSFETGTVFLDQFFTACGPESGGAIIIADCPNFPGVQILDDNFDSSGATLSTEAFKLEAHKIQVSTKGDTLHFAYPNTFHLRGYVIYSLSGLRLRSGAENQTIISALPNGAYIIRMNFQEGTLSKKFIK
ncbi:T9SS type A sorting domain-containing protein [Sungkyunkwania multivorans]|uniref:T9SS type A sorting domain-containing protein n=1 Tax=Sungkyunkwania multivorans TaxID=1173618 RepID=A0ABW3CWY0_9FLAO